MLTRVQQVVVDHLVQDGGCTPELAQEAAAQWGLVPYYEDGDTDKLAAVVMVRGAEIHLVVVPEYRGTGFLTRKRVRGVLEILMRNVGYLTTRTPKWNGRDRLFLDRLGFKPTWSDERFTYYMLTELPFGRKD